MASRDNDRGKLLEALRLSRGLTQKELALTSGVSQAALSKAESSKELLDENRWAVLASVLGVPTRAFSGEVRLGGPSRVYHRKQKSTTKSALNRVQAELDLAQVRTRLLAEGRVPALALSRRPIPDDGFTTPAEIAEAVRAELCLGSAPIGDLTAVLESAGVLLIRADLDTVKVDAIAGWPDDGAPVILLSGHAPGERQRFTMAHELGHAVMHDETATAEQENQANAFASEFLMPGAEVRRLWQSSGMDDLMRLKAYWRVSLAAMIRRGWDLGLLTEGEYRNLNIQLSVTGMNRREPNPIPKERPTLRADAIQEELNSGVTLENLAHRALMLEPEFVTTFLEDDRA